MRPGRGWKKLIGLGLSVLLIAYLDSARSESGMRSSDPEFMQAFVAELRAARIQFRTDDEGMITYAARDAQAVNAIAERVRKDLSSGTSLKFPEDEQRRQFLAVLEAAQKKYRIEERSDGVWVRWYPADETESRELPLRAMENWMAARGHPTLPCEPSGSARDGVPATVSLDKNAAKGRASC